MKLNFRKIKNLILKEFYPNGYKCLCCGDELSTNTLYSFCNKCTETLPYNNGKICVKCGAPITGMGEYCIQCKNIKPYFKKNISVFLYEKPIDDFIRRLKFDNEKYLANTFSNYIAGEIVKLDVNFDFVVSVPLHKERQRRRGYNQAELLCKALKEKLNLTVRSDILIKTINTRSQADLSREERIRNLDGVFKVSNPKEVSGKVALIVDDVFTTGTTINECAKTLLDAGAKAVYSITLAHSYDTKQDK